MSKVSSIQPVATPSAGLVYPPLQGKKGSTTPYGGGRSSHSVKTRTQSSAAAAATGDPTLPSMDSSVMLDPPVVAGSNPNCRKARKTTLFVHDSGVALVSSGASFGRQPWTSVEPSNHRPYHRSAPSPSPSPPPPSPPPGAATSSHAGGQGEIEDDWEVVYPDD